MGMPSGISVVIPSYNRVDVLWKAIESVRAQSLPVSEIIVVDDCSSDSTVAWLTSTHPTIRVVRLDKKSGASFARNVGVQAARFSHVAFLDSDDIFFPEKCDRQWQALMRSGQRASTSGFITSTGKKYSTHAPRPGEIWTRNCLGGTSGLLAETPLLMMCGFDPVLSSAQDWDLYLRLGQYTMIEHIAEPLYRYEVGRSDQITRQKRSRLVGHSRLWRRHILPAKNLSRRVKFIHRVRLKMLVSAVQGKWFNEQFWRVGLRLLGG